MGRFRRIAAAVAPAFTIAWNPAQLPDEPAPNVNETRFGSGAFIGVIGVIGVQANAMRAKGSDASSLIDQCTNNKPPARADRLLLYEREKPQDANKAHAVMRVKTHQSASRSNSCILS